MLRLELYDKNLGKFIDTYFRVFILISVRLDFEKL